MRLRLLAAVPFVLAWMATAAAAQYEPPDPPQLRPYGEARRGRGTETNQEQTEPGDRSFDVSLAAGTWVWLSHFRADTLTERFEIKGPSTLDVRLAVTIPVYEQLEIEIAPEYALGDGTSTWAVGISAALRVDLFDEWGGMTEGKLRPRLGFVVGGFDWNKAPGSFKTGFGAEFGVELAAKVSWLPEAMSLTAGLDLRSLTFEFDEDANVRKTDSAYGGFGLIFRFGMRYAF